MWTRNKNKIFGLCSEYEESFVQIRANAISYKKQINEITDGKRQQQRYDENGEQTK